MSYNLLITLKKLSLSLALRVSPGSVYRDEFDLAILKLQEDNRLEILKRKWWDGGKCPKEEDHRAKGLSLVTPHLARSSASLHLFKLLLEQLFVCFIFFNKCLLCISPSQSNISYPCLSRFGYGEHWRHFRGVGVWPAGGYLHGSAGVCLDVKADTRKWGERGVSNLHLLCLPLLSLASSLSWSC